MESTQPKVYRVKGMHCASCSSIIEKTFKKTEGVHSAEVNYGTEKTKIRFDESKTKKDLGIGSDEVLARKQQELASISFIAFTFGYFADQSMRL